MALFQKGHGGRPKGAKNLKTRAKVARDVVSTQIASVCKRVADVADASAAQNATLSVAVRSTRQGKWTPIAVLLAAMDDAWALSQSLSEKADALTLALLECEQVRDKLGPDLSQPEGKAREFDLRERRIAAGDAVTKIRNQIVAIRGEARQALTDATGWAKDAAPYEHAKLMSANQKVDTSLTVVRKVFVIAPKGKVDTLNMQPQSTVIDVLPAALPGAVPAVEAPTPEPKARIVPSHFKGKTYHVA